MKIKIQLLMSLLGLLMMGNCTSELRPFTSDILREGSWSDSDLQKIQFYLSEDIVIRRNVTESQKAITAGTIKIVKGEKVEEVKIPKGTPGIFLFREGKDHFAIGFDATNDKRYLMFGANPNKSGEYVLLASKWEDRMGKIKYDNSFYFAEETAAYAHLLVDLRKIRRVEVSKKTELGRKVQ